MIELEAIVNYLEGNASQEEKELVNSWLEADPKNLDYFEKVKNSLNSFHAYTSFKNIDVDKDWELVKRRMAGASAKNARGSRHFYLSPFLRIAAVLVLIVLTAGALYFFVRTPQQTAGLDELYELTVPYGGKSSLTLPDGSRVHLNAGSTLTFAKEFGINSRELHLEGEGLFEVEKHKFPMLVHTSHIDIEVLGTVFNVKSYSEDNNIETVLLKGSIRVETLDENNDVPIYLKPNEKLVYNKVGAHTRVGKNEQEIVSGEREQLTPGGGAKQSTKHYNITSNVDVSASVAWKNGKYIVKGETFEELANILTRKFDVSFTFENEEIKEYTFSGTLGDYPIDQVLDVLCLASPVVYDIKEKQVYLAIDRDKLDAYNNVIDLN